MSKNTIKTEEVKAVPFFARFLEEQSAPNSDNAPYPDTRKFPSDWEER
ncbi:MAG: microviridin/marinostatin family tricyclic proteinase inhibitor [Rivularia sp. (in: cyanobacteria)]